MTEREVTGLLIRAGALLLLIGGLVAVGALGWFGRLPGDLRFGSGSVRVYVPLATSLVLSLLLTAVLALLTRMR